MNALRAPDPSALLTAITPPRRALHLADRRASPLSRYTFDDVDVRGYMAWSLME